MRWAIDLCILILLVLVIGCSEDSTTGPEDDGNYTLEDTQTIGLGGGIIEAEDFSLTIPAGAFDGDQHLELYASTEDQPFGEDGVSRTFMIDGLPDEYHEPLDMSIIYEGLLSDLSFIAIGDESYATDSGEMTIGYLMCTATDSIGALHCVLPEREYEEGISTGLIMASPQSGTNAFRARAISRQDTIKTDHFRVVYPKYGSEYSWAKKLGTFLEEAYSEYLDLNFDLDGYEWPCFVIVRDLGEDRDGSFRLSRQFGWRGYLEFNRTLANDESLPFPQTRLAAGHELFHLVQSLYDPRWPWTQAKSKAVHFWLDEATATQIEEKFTDDQSFIPGPFRGNEMAPFDGLQPRDSWSGIQKLKHGYGMSVLIDYFLETYAEDMRRMIYVKLKENGTPLFDPNTTYPVESIIEATSQPDEWLLDFFVEYVSGNLYDVEKYVFMSDMTDVHIAGEGITSAATWTSSDLSAHLYSIIPETESIESITFSTNWPVPDEIGIALFKDRTGLSFELLSYGYGQQVLNGVSAILDDGSNLAVLVVNTRAVSPYTGSSDLILNLDVVAEEDPEDPEVIGFRSFDFKIRVVGHWRHVLGDITNEYESDLEEEPWGAVNVISGEMTDETTFEGSFESEGATGEVMAIFNADLDTVRTLNLEMNWSGSGGRELFHSFAAKEIPRSDDLPDWSWFRVDSAKVCNYLDDVQYTSIIPANDETKTLTGYHCTDGGSYSSLIFFQFHKEQN